MSLWTVQSCLIFLNVKTGSSSENDWLLSGDKCWTFQLLFSAETPPLQAD